MKYLKRFNESIEDIDSICREYGIRNYTVNPDGTVDVDSDVLLSEKKLTRLPIKFGKVSGYFDCSYNLLTTLEGCPKEVGGSFWCNFNKLTTLEGCATEVRSHFNCGNNKLTTLEGCPTSVGGDFYCHYNKLTSLKGAPKIVDRNFICSENQLTTLEGCPKEVGRDFECYKNKLTTLEFGPTEVVGHFYCYNNQLTIINWNDVYTLNPTRFDLEDNPIFEVYNIFPDFETFRDSLEWNYFKEPNIIIRNKFVEACEILEEETGIKIKTPKKIKGYIFE